MTEALPNLSKPLSQAKPCPKFSKYGCFHSCFSLSSTRPSSPTHPRNVCKGARSSIDRLSLLSRCPCGSGPFPYELGKLRQLYLRNAQCAILIQLYGDVPVGSVHLNLDNVGLESTLSSPFSEWCGEPGVSQEEI